MMGMAIGTPRNRSATPAREFLARPVLEAPELARLDGQGVIEVHAAKGGPVGTQGMGEGVAAVVPVARHDLAVAEPVQWLAVESNDMPAAPEQHVLDGAGGPRWRRRHEASVYDDRAFRDMGTTTIVRGHLMMMDAGETAGTPGRGPRGRPRRPRARGGA